MISPEARMARETCPATSPEPQFPHSLSGVLHSGRHKYGYKALCPTLHIPESVPAPTGNPAGGHWLLPFLPEVQTQLGEQGSCLPTKFLSSRIFRCKQEKPPEVGGKKKKKSLYVGVRNKSSLEVPRPRSASRIL